MKYMEGELNNAKNFMEDALRVFDDLGHIFGIHFLNR